MADPGALVTIQSDEISNLWVVDDGKAMTGRQITSGAVRHDGTNGIAWTPDGRLVYASRASGNYDIWITQSDGSDPKQLTMDARTNWRPAVSHDGRYIVFASDRTGIYRIWRMDIDGGNLKRLTSGRNDGAPECVSDGTAVIYHTYEGQFKLLKVPIDGGTPVQLSKSAMYAAWPAVSPDGTTIAFTYRPEQASSKQMVGVMPLEADTPTRLFDIPTVYVRWTRDGSALTYVKDQGGVSNIWSQSVAGGSPKQVTDFQTDRIFSFDWSWNGRQLALARGVVNSDVVLIRDLR
jgi:Tol biopolymer transport system component